MSRVVFLPSSSRSPVAANLHAAPIPASASAAPTAPSPDATAPGAIAAVRRIPQLPWLARVGTLATAAMVLLVLLGMLGNSTIDGYRQSSASAGHASQVKEQLRLTFSQMMQAESAGRGFVLLGDPALDARYLRASDEVERAAATLHRMVEDNPEQSRNAGMLERILAERLGQLDAVKTEFQRKGIAGAQSRIADNLALPQAAAIDALVQRMAQIEDRLLEERSAHADAAEQRLRLVGPLATSLCILLLAFTCFGVLREQARRTRAESRLQASQRELERSLEESRESARYLAQLGELGDLLQGCRSIDEAMEVLRAVAPGLVGVGAGDIYFGDDGTADFTRVGGWGNTGRAQRTHIARGDCWAVRRGQLFPAGDSIAGICCPHVHAGSGHSICVPLAAHGEAQGVLVVHCTSVPTAVQRRLLRSVAEQLSLALANLRLQESLRSQSIRDPLTGLYNRRYLDATLAREVSRAQRQEQELSLLIIDIDHFKRINDTFGHEAGDTVLAQVAATLDLGTRGADVACRYGGEEFVVLMPGADLRSAQRRAEELRAAIESCVATWAGRPVGPVTVSVGVATYPPEGGDGASLRHAADQALYTAKRAGRNRVEVAAAA